MAREIENWQQVSREDFFALPNNNVYVREHGYLNDHVSALSPKDLNLYRDDSDHWNKQFENPEAFKKAWKPRFGHLELVYNLAQQKEGEDPFTVVSLGAGLGDFTVDLARIPNIQVTHVDFSEKANEVARKRAEEHVVLDRVEIVTNTNIAFLTDLTNRSVQVDFIFIYGGLGENTPLEAKIEETLTLATRVLKPGGHLWHVGLEQPFLLGKGDFRAQDILGEYPVRPGLIGEVFTKRAYYRALRGI